MRLRDVADEVGDVVIGRRADQLLGPARLDDRSVAHDHDVVAELERLGEVVGDEDHRLPDLVVQPDDLVLHVPPDQRVEGAERLVQEHHLGIHRECPRQPDALLLTPGQLVRVRVEVWLQPDQRRPSRGRARDASRGRRHGSRARTRRCPGPGGAAGGRSSGTPWRIVGAGARASAAGLPRGCPAPSSRTSPEARLDEARQAADERRLAAPGQAHDDEHLAAPHVERDVAHGDRGARPRSELSVRQLEQLPIREPILGGSEDLPQVAHGERRRGIGIERRCRGRGVPNQGHESLRGGCARARGNRWAKGALLNGCASSASVGLTRWRRILPGSIESTI